MRIAAKRRVAALRAVTLRHNRERDKMIQKLQKLEMLYKTGRLDRYRYQNALTLLFQAGVLTLPEYSSLYDEAVGDSIVDLD